MIQFWFIKETKNFVGVDDSGNNIHFPIWRENVVDLWAVDLLTAKATARLTGIKEGSHYNDIVEVKGFE